MFPNKNTTATMTPMELDINMNEQKPNSCICDRGVGILLCKQCGHMTKGRASKVCPCHANVKFTMDIFLCPLCKAPFLEEYKI